MKKPLKIITLILLALGATGTVMGGSIIGISRATGTVFFLNDRINAFSGIDGGLFLNIGLLLLVGALIAFSFGTSRREGEKPAVGWRLVAVRVVFVLSACILCLVLAISLSLSTLSDRQISHVLSPDGEQEIILYESQFLIAQRLDVYVRANTFFLTSARQDHPYKTMHDCCLDELTVTEWHDTGFTIRDNLRGEDFHFLYPKG